MSFCKRKNIVNVVLCILFFSIAAVCLISSFVLKDDDSLGDASEILSEICLLFVVLGCTMLVLPSLCSSRFGGDETEEEKKPLYVPNLSNSIVSLNYATPIQV